jgi:hypothetical protein
MKKGWPWLWPASASLYNIETSYRRRGALSFSAMKKEGKSSRKNDASTPEACAWPAVLSGQPSFGQWCVGPLVGNLMMNNNEKNVVTQPSGKGWLLKVKKGVKIIGNAAGVILAAPIKLPGKLLTVAKYLALLAGIVKATEKKDEPADE